MDMAGKTNGWTWQAKLVAISLAASVASRSSAASSTFAAVCDTISVYLEYWTALTEHGIVCKI